MDEREKRISDIYDEFTRFGIINADDADTEHDATVRQETLQATLEQYKNDIDLAYEHNDDRMRQNLLHHTMLGLMVHGGTNEEIAEFLKTKRIRKNKNPEMRRMMALNAMAETQVRADRARKVKLAQSEYLVDEDSARSLAETLDDLCERECISMAQREAVRGLLGVSNGVQPLAQVDELAKSRVAILLRTKLSATEFSNSNRVQEGSRLLHQLTRRARRGYLSVGELAKTLSEDNEIRRTIPYGSNIETNQAMIETFVSEALDVMYPRTD
jgi:hypothetical protein